MVNAQEINTTAEEPQATRQTANQPHKVFNNRRSVLCNIKQSAQEHTTATRIQYSCSFSIPLHIHCNSPSFDFPRAISIHLIYFSQSLPRRICLVVRNSSCVLPESPRSLELQCLLRPFFRYVSLGRAYLFRYSVLPMQLYVAHKILRTPIKTIM